MHAEFPTCLETALSKISWIWRSNSHTSDTGITPPKPKVVRKEYQQGQPRGKEMSCSMSRVACTVAPTPVWKSVRDWSAFLLAEFKEIISGGIEAKNPKAAGWLEKIMDQFRCQHLGSQRHRGKKSPSLAPQFMSWNARTNLHLIIIRKGTNQVEKSRRDWRCNGIKLIQGSVQFQCLEWISEDGVQASFKVGNSLIQKGIILTAWFQGRVG